MLARLSLALRAACAIAAFFASPPAGGGAPAQATESVKNAICRFIDDSAARNHLPASFLTRLIWNESSFRTDVVSSAGAQGIAQFMPSAAAERGLANPFDPEQAIGKSAELLADLKQQFGNLGLAAAAYNAGAARVAAWLGKQGGLPFETQDYVWRITGRTAEDWAGDLQPSGTAHDQRSDKTGLPMTGNCLTVTANLRIRSKLPPPSIFAPWGVQLAASFSRAAALAAFDRSLGKYRRVVSDARPMIIGSRLLSRGFAPFYRIRIPEPTREAAERQCSKILAIGGACVAMRS